jgi:hypothetical protein
VAQRIGVPIYVGSGTTETLAKPADRLAKVRPGFGDWMLRRHYKKMAD